MYLYQAKFDRYEYMMENEGDIYPVMLFQHYNLYTKEQFQKIINKCRKEMRNDVVSFHYLPEYLKEFGFDEVVTGYFDD